MKLKKIHLKNNKEKKKEKIRHAAGKGWMEHLCGICFFALLETFGELE
jgi:hypothetical protein